MVSTIERRHLPSFHPVHGVLLGGTTTLFLGALLSDIAYARTFEIQWINFAAWLITGGLLVAAAALVCALLALFPARRTRASLLHFIVLAAAFVLGIFNALVHARDAWASMPAGLVLSAIVFLLACVATWIASGTSRTGGLA